MKQKRLNSTFFFICLVVWYHVTSLSLMMTSEQIQQVQLKAVRGFFFQTTIKNYYFRGWKWTFTLDMHNIIKALHCGAIAEILLTVQNLMKNFRSVAVIKRQ